MSMTPHMPAQWRTLPRRPGEIFKKDKAYSERIYISFYMQIHAWTNYL